MLLSLCTRENTTDQRKKKLGCCLLAGKRIVSLDHFAVQTHVHTVRKDDDISIHSYVRVCPHT